MDFTLYIQIVKAIFKELWRFRYLAMLLGFLAAMAGAVVGYFWPESYVSRATLYADETNIISPLLSGQAATTQVNNQRQIVRDIMLSNKALERLIESEGFLKGEESAAERSAIVNQLREAVSVRSLSNSYIEVSYPSAIPERAFTVVKRLVDMFINESSESKRSESRQAYLFIDKQVSAYKEQLQLAEKKLKDFNAANLDGTETQALADIESTRREIETIELNLEQAQETAESLTQQVTNEDRYLSEKARSDVYNERIVQAIEQLDDLRLVYTDNHPDVIALQEHIAALRSAKDTSGEGDVSNISSDVENPVYDQLRSALAAAKVETNSIKRRLNSLNQRLAEGRARLQRIVSRNAELTELTRDYDVTRGLYEDLLERKEQARLSMTLDIEGQGLNYKVQEPPNFPQLPSGLRFVHFVLFGVLAGIALPIGLVIAYVVLDPRIRFANQIQEAFDVPLLAEVPHLSSSLSVRLSRGDAKLSIFWMMLACLVYCSSVLLLAYVF